MIIDQSAGAQMNNSLICAPLLIAALYYFRNKTSMYKN